MTYLDLTGELLRVVDFAKSEIIHPKRLTFVCGGKSNGTGLAPTSLREALLGHAARSGSTNMLGGSEVILAEAAMSALDKSSFTNLLDLEEYIAALSDSIILIVESPGSMCELGAFVKIPEIRSKLIVIMPSDYIGEASFIVSGAIRYLREHHISAQVFGYDWGFDKLGSLSVPGYTLSKMSSEIPLAMKLVQRAQEREIFNEASLGHLIYLALAFCHLLRSAKLSDLRHCFAESNISISETSVKKCLDTLTVCKLIKPVTHGKLTLYVAQTSRMPFKIAWRAGTPNINRNALRWIQRLSKQIEAEDEDRIEIFRRHHVA